MKYEFRFPDIGEGIAEGTLLKWLVQEGEIIKEGQDVAEVETDKVTTEIPSPKSGKVIDLKYEEGDLIEVEDVFIMIDTDSKGETPQEKPPKKSVEEDSEEEKKKTLDEKEEEVEEETAGVVGEVVASSEEIPPSTEGQEPKEGDKDKKKRKVLATPVARKLAKDLGIDISTVSGTGPNGRVMKEDIKNKSQERPKDQKESSKEEKAKEKQKSQAPSYQPREGENVERIALSNIRKTIAKQMETSKFTIPHTTVMEEIDVTELGAYRKKFKERLKEEDIHLTYLPFIIKALIAAIKKYPSLNASYDGDNQELILKHFYHIGIATDTDRGLMVPVVKNADTLSIVEIAQKITDLSTRAKNGNLELQELRGSTISITNYGSIGGLFAAPVINYPEAAILGLGRIIDKPVVKDGEIEIAKVLPISLSIDHRIIDGATASRFLNSLRDLLKDPEMLLLKA